MDGITYSYINHFYITLATPNLVNDFGDILYLEGDGFMNTPALNCRFGLILATSVKYYNRTKIHCGTPPITDKSVKYPIAVTFNGVEYLYFNDSTNTPINLAFTANMTVLDIVPFMAF